MILRTKFMKHHLHIIYDYDKSGVCSYIPVCDIVLYTR